MPDLVLEMLNITKKFPGVLALDDVSLSCNGGEVHALVGENGAGKSTLMKILAGALQPDKGDIRLRGRPRPAEHPRRGAATGHRHHLPGVQPAAVAERGGEHSGGPPAQDRPGADRLDPGPRASPAVTRPAGRLPGPAGARAGPQRGPATAGRNREGAVPQVKPDHHGRALGGLGRARAGAIIRRHSHAERPGGDDHLHFPPPGRSVRDCRPGDRRARRPRGRHAHRRGNRQGHTHPHDGRPHAGRNVPAESGRHRRAAAEGSRG